MIQERINALRIQMYKEAIDLYLVPTSDFHDSEYVGDYFKCRKFMSGFTGSAGTLLVSRDGAWLWTDGRYFLQAGKQLEGSGIELMKMYEEGVPEIHEFIEKNLPEGGCLGFDGRVYSVSSGQKLEEAVTKRNGKIIYELDLVDRIWIDRPSMSAEEVMVLETKYCGVSAKDKINTIREKMQKKNCKYHILTALDDIAWLLNLRGGDVECNPVFLSYLIITTEDITVFANETIFTKCHDYLSELNAKVLPYNDIYEYVKGIERGANIMIDSNKLNYSLYMTLKDRFSLINVPNPTTAMKAEKNITERLSLREANIIDGVAMVRFLHWLDDNIGKIKITEISASDKLEEFRSEGEGFMGLSFETIAGYNQHGAIIHYGPTPETDIEVEPHGLLLVDSGAQYLTGTTDITRTIAVGPLTEEMKHHYTVVLRGNLNLAAAKFKEGCSGANLDILARAPFWEDGIDYNHGTGHGVGFFLNVHEGPQSFHWNATRKATLISLKEGMVITDEPGIYIEGKYGIRIENDLLCLKDTKNEYGQFMKFEPLTLCPIDLRPVNFEEMTEKEIKTLKEYHELVVKALSPRLNDSDKEWLLNAVKMPE